MKLNKKSYVHIDVVLPIPLSDMRDIIYGAYPFKGHYVLYLFTLEHIYTIQAWVHYLWPSKFGKIPPH